MNFFRRLLLIALSLSATAALAQTYRNMSSVHDGSGTMSTNTVNLSGIEYTNVSAAGQPGGINISSNGTLVNYAGFLQAVDIKRPDLDTDHDGVIDEISADNDSDTLADLTEVQGNTFDPNTPTYVNVADSDDDGLTDGAEAAAGTDPLDENANLRILSVSSAGGGKQITYLARSQKNYIIRGDDDGYSYPTNYVGTGAETNGVGAWQVRTNTFVDSSSPTNSRFFAVQPQ